MRILFSFLLILSFTSASFAFQCNECHSKNPAMVKMHKALQGRWCFDCHKMGEKLMGKGAANKNTEARFKRRETDPLCFECHKKK